MFFQIGVYCLDQVKTEKKINKLVRLNLHGFLTVEVDMVVVEVLALQYIRLVMPYTESDV